MTEVGKADLLISGGRIFTGLAGGFVEALAIVGDRVLAVGGHEALEVLAGPATRGIDLAGRALVPGFNDGHQHMLLYGLETGEVNLHPRWVATLEALLERLREKAAETPPGDWILGRRYDHFHLDIARHPTRWELDRAVPHHPCYITRTCGHVGVAKSAALAAAGITAESPNPPGGEIGRREGELDGSLFETAQDLIKAVLPLLSKEEMVAALERAGRDFLAQGITSVTDAGLGLRQRFDDFEAYRSAHRQNRLPVRSYLAMTGGPHGIDEEARSAGLMTGQGDDMLRIGPVKLFADGSAGGKTAAMTLPYICACQNRGLFVYEDRALSELVADYHGRGYQFAIHAIGDAAIDQALNAVEAAGSGTSAGLEVPKRRHRIEHCGFTRPDQISRMARLGMIPAPQPVFLYEFGELYVEVLGSQRPAEAYPMRSWIAAGLAPIASSDTPVSDFSPLKNLYCMVTRKTDRGRVLGAGETLDLPTAVSALTLNGAYGSFEEDLKGSLLPGRLADFAVLERNIFAAPAESLLETRVDLTCLGGRLVHDRLGEF